MKNLEEDLVDKNWIQRNWPRVKGKIGKITSIVYLISVGLICIYGSTVKRNLMNIDHSPFSAYNHKPYSQNRETLIYFDSTLTHKIHTFMIGKEFDPETTDVYMAVQRRFWGKDWSYEKEWKMLSEGSDPLHLIR